MVYQVVVYVAQQMAERFRLPLVLEGVAAGLVAVIMYTPYDLIGPTMPWWTWKMHLTTVSRWLGVPYSSTLWMFLFHGLIAVLIRWADQRRRRGLVPMGLWVLGVAVLTLLGGFVLFLPYHGLRFVGLGDGAILLLFLGIGFAAVLWAKPKPAGPQDRTLWLASLCWHGFFLVASMMAPTPIVWVATPMILTSLWVQVWLSRTPVEPA